MSETRVYEVVMTQQDCIASACKELGIEMKEREKGKVYVLSNHGVITYRGTEITLSKVKEGVYSLSGDCSAKLLENLGKKIKGMYKVQVIIKTAKHFGFNVVQNTQEKNKVKMKLRIFK